MVKEKRFREDLYYRLNVITIRVPPLRERREDVRLLAQHFVSFYAAKNNRKLEGLTEDALRRLEAYAWPGNVRELENVVERGVVLARGALIDVPDLPEEVSGATPIPEGVLTVRIGTPLAEVEQRLLDETLRITRGNKTLDRQAARHRSPHGLAQARAPRGGGGATTLPPRRDGRALTSVAAGDLHEGPHAHARVSAAHLRRARASSSIS